MLSCRWNAISRGALLRSTRLTHVSKPLNSHSFIPRLSLNPPPIAHHRCLNTNPPNRKPALAARIVGSLPQSVKPYAYLARIDKPVGSWLLYWPCGSILQLH